MCLLRSEHRELVDEAAEQLISGTLFSLPVPALQNMNANPQTNIRIVGHTDSTGKHAYNVGLSKRRAESVVNFLREHQVSSTRMTLDGVGPDQPIADNGTPEGRAKNRRVEVFILPSQEMINEAKAEAAKQK